MNTNYRIFFAFILGVTARIIVSPWILKYDDPNYTFHKNKLYDAILIGSIIGIIQIILDLQNLTNAQILVWLLIYLCMFKIIAYFIENQIFVNNLDILLKLRENYAESVKLIENLVKNNYQPIVKDFLNKNLEIKSDTINEINNLIKTIK